MIDSSKQYLQSELPSDVFNSGNGDIKQFNGRAVKISVNGNGTRSLSDMGDFNTYQAGQKYDNLVSSDSQSITDFLGKYKGDVQSAQTNANNEFHVPEFGNLVTGLTSRISSLENNSGNAAGGDTGNQGNIGALTQGNVDAAISSRYLPQLNAAEANLNTGATLAAKNVDQALAPDQAFEDLLKTNITTSMQGLTDTQRNTLTYLIGQLDAGVSLTNTQRTVGEQLAQTILENANKVTTAQLANQYQKVPSGSYLINTLGANPQNVFYGQ